jgi:hypothetical protein
MTHILQPNAAGVDIGATEIYIAVPPDRDAQPVRSFRTFTGDLKTATEWLKQCRIETVAMESTSVNWVPFFQILEAAGFKVFLVNARHVKNVPGRKSDVADCQWLQYLHSVGLLRASFRPEQAVCAVRSILRHRDSLVQIATIHVQHMQKALDQMNLQLHHVISDITGISGIAIIEAILNGERDPIVLSQSATSGLKLPAKPSPPPSSATTGANTCSHSDSHCMRIGSARNSSEPVIARLRSTSQLSIQRLIPAPRRCPSRRIVTSPAATR